MWQESLAVAGSIPYHLCFVRHQPSYGLQQFSVFDTCEHIAYPIYQKDQKKVHVQRLSTRNHLICILQTINTQQKWDLYYKVISYIQKHPNPPPANSVLLAEEPLHIIHHYDSRPLLLPSSSTMHVRFLLHQAVQKSSLRLLSEAQRVSFWRPIVS
jgi:hypothetical protein